MKKIVLIIVTFYLLSCTTTKNIDEVTPMTSDQLPFPSLMNVNKQQFVVQSMIKGTVIDISNCELGMLQIVISTKYTYYYKGNTVSLEYFLVFGGMEELYKNMGDEVDLGENLGLASTDSYLTAYSNNLDDFMLRMTEDKAVNYNNLWYFTPNWLISRGTAWLTFKPVNSFKTALDGYYNRVILEGKNSSGTQIFHYEPFDRIRFKTKLDTYPVVANTGSSIKEIEEKYYRDQEVFVLESEYKEYKVNDYSVKIYWQNKFDEYLINEYQLGDELYIYGSIYAFDHDKKEILICVRDFSLQSDEEIIAQKRKQLDQ